MNYDEWIGREESSEERILASVATAAAATFDLDAAPAAGANLPPGWQWMYFNAPVRRSGLGSDGHPKRGGFLPPIELPRRMWAGSRVRYLSPVPIESRATKLSRIVKVENKTGKRGSLWFVTVQHSTSCGGQVCIDEEQDIVYREASPPGTPLPPSKRHEDAAVWSREVVPDTTLLFRYSALTFNGHKIHYDLSYTRNDEGYANLVVHGPLTATLLQQFALEHGEGLRLSRFDFRAVSTLFVDRPFTLEGRPNEDGTLALWARGPDGELAMSANADFVK